VLLLVVQEEMVSAVPTVALRAVRSERIAA
jgi:hypothetical protein